MMNTVQQMSSFEFQMVCVVRLLLASVLFLTLFLCLFQLLGASFPEEFHPSLGGTHLDGGGIKFSIIRLETDRYFLTAHGSIVFFRRKRIIFHLTRNACLLYGHMEQFIGHRVFGKVAGFGFFGTVVNDYIHRLAEIAGSLPRSWEPDGCSGCRT